MVKYSVSAFIQIMQNGLVENNKQEAAGRLLLESIMGDDHIDISLYNHLFS